MSGWFNLPARVAALLAEAASWIGTPFRAHSKAKGRAGGVDCVRLCEAVMVNVGLTEPFEFPRAPMDYSMHQERSIILEFLRGQNEDPQSKRLASIFEEVWTRPDDEDDESDRIVVAMPGDLLTFKIGKAVHHMAIAISDTQFVHCFRGIGTVYGNLTDPTFGDRLHSIFRARA